MRVFLVLGVIALTLGCRSSGPDCTLLGSYIDSDDSASLDRAISRGCKVTQDIDGDVDLLGKAALQGSLKCVNVLLQAGANPNRRFGKTLDSPLHLACLADQYSSAVTLAKAGADVKLKNGAGATPLMLASRNTDSQLVEFLISQGSDVSASNKSGWTSLHFAAAARPPSRDVIRLLLKAGADSKARTSSGKTPRDLAVKNGNQSIENLLQE